jgi:MFS family permease
MGLALCFVSLLSSSYVPNEHYLFLTYSIPFGIGSSIVFILGSVVTGMYYPPSQRYHISATVAISLGFPLGFLILNTFNDFLLSYFNNDWQRVQFIYSITTLVCLLGLSLFFTEKYAEYDEMGNNDVQHEVVFNETIFNLDHDKFAYLIQFLWLFGLLLNSCANNAVLIHLVITCFKSGFQNLK